LADAPRRRVGCIDFTIIPLSEAVGAVVELGVTGVKTGTAIHFANAYNIALAEKDQDYREVLRRGDAVVSDGMPVVWAGRRLHSDVAPAWTRVYGPEVMGGVLSASGAEGPRHYLLGGSRETLEALRLKIAQAWPDAVVVGAQSPSFGTWSPEELQARDEDIASSGATLVWVGLGTPKQDWEVRRLADSLPVTALAVGAAFDFLSGSKRQAPVWMQRSGLEWSYRLAREPRRLAKRYLWGNPTFVASVVRHHSKWKR